MTDKKWHRVWKIVRSELHVWRVGALPGLAVILLVCAARLTGSLQFLELVALDNLLRSRPPEPMDERIVIVGIDEDDIRRIGTYPIPDRNLATLIQTIQTYKPAAIGLDIVRDLPVPPGHTDLVGVFRSTPNLIGIEWIIPSRMGKTVNPPPDLPAEQVGFADLVADSDGFLRRSLLGSSDNNGNYHFSLAIRLAATYLAKHQIRLENGIHDPIAMRFGATEFTRFQANAGGYVGADAGGNQILLNFRTGKTPFRLISFQQLQAQTVDPSWLRDKIVLIGVVAPSAKDVVSVGAIPNVSLGLIYGVEFHAHTISQIISAVLDHRPLLQTWSDGWEYVWIIGWGILGISLGRFLRSPWKILLGLGIASGGLVTVCYSLMLLGWWVPFVPALLVLVLNGAGLTAALFYRYEQNLRTRIADRQLVIEQTFNAIHNGPLQTIAGLLRSENLPPQQLRDELQQLNRELRSIYESVRQETLGQQASLYLSGNHLDLQRPLHELLCEVYTHTRNRNLPCFQTIKVNIVKFEPLSDQSLNPEQKRGLCRFLEEALCNVGKHALGVTRLTVTCTEEGGKQVIRVADNGTGMADDFTTTTTTAPNGSAPTHDGPAIALSPLPRSSFPHPRVTDSRNEKRVGFLNLRSKLSRSAATPDPSPAVSNSVPSQSCSSGLGTKQAEMLAKQLGGKFRRFPNTPRGTVCEFTWSTTRLWFRL